MKLICRDLVCPDLVWRDLLGEGASDNVVAGVLVTGVLVTGVLVTEVLVVGVLVIGAGDRGAGSRSAGDSGAVWIGTYDILTIRWAVLPNFVKKVLPPLPRQSFWSYRLGQVIGDGDQCWCSRLSRGITDSVPSVVSLTIALPGIVDVNTRWWRVFIPLKACLL